MFNIKNKTRNDQIIDLIISQIERLLKEMQEDGKDLSLIKLKKFQKTHHIDCLCNLCTFAKSKNDPRLRGLTEDGFKVYLNNYKKSSL